MANAASSAQNERAVSAGPTAHGRATFSVGLFLFSLAIVLAYLLLTVWPTSTVEEGRTVWLNLTESTALAIAMICGALGSYVHVATSFASFAGNRSLEPSWVWWFLLRPAIGAALALITYFLMRSGFLLDGPLGEVVSPFGIAAVSACVGLISKQAVDKMRNISDTAFNTAQDAERNDKL